MSDVVIRVENLSKKYVIHHNGGSSGGDGLRHALDDIATAPMRWLRKAGILWGAAGRSRFPTSLTPASRNILAVNNSLRSTTEEFYALRDVSFEIKRGEVVGIIGRNGAGKSTLLKILSRITEPSNGRIGIKGRVASLLEVGTGFHHELSGRENVFLNGAILGMTRTEVRRKFDEIVDFAEVEQFIDTPVKHYSSGMYVRLAFAVAAHLEPDILIVDEVLAVGDQRFQTKCLGKIESVSSEGRTVIFVSHFMPVINRLCRSAVLLSQGKVMQIGPASKVTSRYLAGDGVSSGAEWVSAKNGTVKTARLLRIRLCDNEGQIMHTFSASMSVHCAIEYEIAALNQGIIPAIHIINDQGVIVFASAAFVLREQTRSGGIFISTCIIPGDLLAEGHYSFLFALVSYNPDIVHEIERDLVSMQVVDPASGGGARGDAGSAWPGIVRPKLEWRIG